MAIKANTGSASIIVNEKGDTIDFFISDNDFLMRFADFAQWFWEVKDKSDDEDNEGSDGADDFLGVIAKFKSKVTEQKDLTKQVMDRLEEMFGEGTCTKMFGSLVSPTFRCVTDAAAQLIAEIMEISNKDNQYYDKKYNLNRKGAKSK